MGVSERNAWFRLLFPEDDQGSKVVTLDKLEGNDRTRQMLMATLPSADYDGAYLKIANRKCFFFYGPAGTGKHRMAMAYAGTLKKYSGYTCLGMKRSRLNRATQEEMEEWVEEILKFSEMGAVFLILEHTSALENGELFLDILMEELEACGPEYNLTLVVCEKDLSLLKEEWQSMFTPVRFDMPGKKERAAFLRKENSYYATLSTGERLERQRVPLKMGLSYDYVADQTEKFNYANMEQLLTLLKLRTKQEGIEQYGEAKALRKAVNEQNFYYDMAQIQQSIDQIRAQMEAMEQAKAVPVTVNNGGGENMAALVTALQGMAAGANGQAAQDKEEFAEMDDDLGFSDFEDYDSSQFQRGAKKHTNLRADDFDYLDN